MSDINPENLLVYKRLRKDHCYTMTGGVTTTSLLSDATETLQKCTAAAKGDQCGLQQRNSLQTCSRMSFS